MMLKLIDNSDYRVPQRGKAPEPFIPKRVVVTSSLSPKECYNRRNDKDSIKQLLRRVKVIHRPIKYVLSEKDNWKLTCDVKETPKSELPGAPVELGEGWKEHNVKYKTWANPRITQDAVYP